MERKTTKCDWFARCYRPAAGVVLHPVLGAVPTCRPCAERFQLELWEHVGSPDSYVLWAEAGYAQVFVPAYPRRAHWVVGRPESDDGNDPGAEYANGNEDTVAQAKAVALAVLKARGAEA